MEQTYIEIVSAKTIPMMAIVACRPFYAVAFFDGGFSSVFLHRLCLKRLLDQVLLGYSADRDR